jgi:hypothetical protein
MTARIGTTGAGAACYPDTALTGLGRRGVRGKKGKTRTESKIKSKIKSKTMIMTMTKIRMRSRIKIKITIRIRIKSRTASTPVKAGVLHGVGRAVDPQNPCRENKEKLTAEQGNAHGRRPGIESRYPGSRAGQAQGRAGHRQWEAVSLVEGNCRSFRRRPGL